MTANSTAPDEGASFHGSTGGPGRGRVGLVLAGAAILVVAVVATSFAASPDSSNAQVGSTPFTLGALDPALDDTDGPDLGRMGAHGFRDITITAISGSDVTLGTPDGWRRTISITSLVELTKGGQDIAVSDLKVGDQVRFRQVRNDDGTYTVTAVAVVVPSIRGTASAITASGFKVTTRDGSVWTVAVNGSTTYSYGQGSGTLADVKDGEAVRVQGTITADNQMTATNVRVAGDRAVGTVTAKTADSITIRRRDGTSLTIHVDADTTYRVGRRRERGSRRRRRRHGDRRHGPRPCGRLARRRCCRGGQPPRPWPRRTGSRWRQGWPRLRAARSGPARSRRPERR